MSVTLSKRWYTADIFLKLFFSRQLVFQTYSKEYKKLYQTQAKSRSERRCQLLTTKVINFLLCTRIFVKSGGTKDISVVEVPLRKPPPANNYKIWHFWFFHETLWNEIWLKLCNSMWTLLVLRKNASFTCRRFWNTLTTNPPPTRNICLCTWTF